MRIVLGRSLGGPHLTARDATPRLGEPVWGPAELLRDLELRLALSSDVAPRSLRVPVYAARMHAAREASAFYARSFSVDRIGTADTLLSWRDALVEAGWNGAVQRARGRRLADLARLELPIEGEPSARGDADRLAAVEDALAHAPRSRIYEEIALADAREQWPGRWRTLFDKLASRGTFITEEACDYGVGAVPSSDLGRLQHALRGGTVSGVAAGGSELSGDGSVTVVCAGTLSEAAEVVAALTMREEDVVVVRSIDCAPLEAALAAQGGIAQGLPSASSCRPAMQILPLALELAFEPRDPRRALELLTLPLGPFRGALGARLARAIARAPGIGGREWRTRKEEARASLLAREVERAVAIGASPSEAASLAGARVDERMQAVAEWLEEPGATREMAVARVAEIAARVRVWLASKLATAPDVYAPAVVQAKAFEQAVALEKRSDLSREDVRQILDTIVRASHERAVVERAGRAPHVHHPAALLASSRVVVLACFVAEAERRPPIQPWNDDERAELDAEGVRLVPTATRLLAERAAWRRAVLLARERVVMVVPDSIRGEHAAPHPLWDEIVARLGLDERAIARITVHVRDILEGRGPNVPFDEIVPLDLPHARAAWSLDGNADLLSASHGERTAAATSIESFVGCPLRWVLEGPGGVASGAISRLADGALLHGALGHRLVEELHIAGAFAYDDEPFAERASSILDLLIRTEGTLMLLPGAGSERVQVEGQLLRAVRELRRYLRRTGARVVAVEEEVSVTTRPLGTLRGRVDLRLQRADGADAILDLKWGEGRYRTLVRAGRAVQLAAYAHALRDSASRAMPPAGYFSLRTGRILASEARLEAEHTIDADGCDATWSRVEQTAEAVASMLRRGVVNVTGTRGSLPLLDALEIPVAERPRFYAAAPDAPCEYCALSAICGRAWEPFR